MALGTPNPDITWGDRLKKHPRLMGTLTGITGLILFSMITQPANANKMYSLLDARPTLPVATDTLGPTARPTPPAPATDTPGPTARPTPGGETDTPTPTLPPPTAVLSNHVYGPVILNGDPVAPTPTVAAAEAVPVPHPFDSPLR